MKRFSALTMIMLVALALGASAALAQTTGAQAAADLRAGDRPHLEGPAQQDPDDGEGHGVPGRQARMEAASGFAQRARRTPSRDDRPGDDDRAWPRARSSTSSAKEKDGRGKPEDARRGGRRKWKRRSPRRTRWSTRRKPIAAADWLARAPGRALRQAGDAYRVNGVVPPISRPKK